MDLDLVGSKEPVPITGTVPEKPFNFIEEIGVVREAMEALELLPSKRRFIAHGYAGSDIYASMNSLYNTLVADRKEADPTYTPLLVPRITRELPLMGPSSLVGRYNSLVGKEDMLRNSYFAQFPADRLNSFYVKDTGVLASEVKVGRRVCDVLALVTSSSDHDTDKGLYFEGLAPRTQLRRAWENQSMYDVTHTDTAMSVCTPGAYIIAQTMKLVRGDSPLDIDTQTNFPHLEFTRDDQEGHFVPTAYHALERVAFSRAKAGTPLEHNGIRLVVAQSSDA